MNRSDLIKGLRILAFAWLLLSLVGTVIAFVNTFERPVYRGALVTEFNPLSILVAFGGLVISLTIWTFLLVVCGIAETLLEIKHNTKEKSNIE
jgi:hypothetical protein